MKDEVIKQTKSLFISAGHSNTDPGAVANGYSEADIVLEFRNLLAAHLDGEIAFGCDGEGETNMPLRDAVYEAAMSDVAVEFHCNAFSSSQATGVETLGTVDDEHLGESLCSAISGTLGIPSRGHKPEGAGQHSRLAFVSDGGGLIVELFFLTNEDDLRRYLKHKHEVVAAVADVLIEEVS